MCFAPQRRALFQHLNFQKWSERGVFCTFWLGDVLPATTACTFSTSQLPKAVRSSGVLYILTWKCASRHNGVHFFDIATFQCSEAEVFCTFWLRHVLRATRACNFSSLIWPAGSAPAALASLLFDPPEPQIIGKTQCFTTFLPFHASASSFFSTFLSSNLSLLSASSLLCFSSVHIVGSLTSKLPSVKFQNWRRLAEMLRFGCCQVQKVKKSRRIVSFLTLSSSNIEESLIELLRFWRCQVQNLRTSRRIVSLLTLQIGR